MYNDCPCRHSYIICNGEDVVRRLPSTPPQTGDEFRKKMGILAQKARHVVRDNNPLVSRDTWHDKEEHITCITWYPPVFLQHDLHYLRIRAAKQEIMVAVGNVLRISYAGPMMRDFCMLCRRWFLGYCHSALAARCISCRQLLAFIVNGPTLAAS